LGGKGTWGAVVRARGQNSSGTALIAALKDPDSGVRAAAARALEEIGDKTAVPALIAALKDPDSGVRAAAARALEKIGDKTAAVPALIAALKDPDKEVRRGAAWALGEIGDTSAVPALIAALKDPDRSVWDRVTKALAKLGDKSAVPLMIAALKDPRKEVRAGAAIALGTAGDRAGIQPLIEALKDVNELVRAAAASALGLLRDRTTVSLFIAALKDPDFFVRGAAAWALGEIGETSAVPPLIEALKDANGWVRAAAVGALGRLRERKAVPPLIEALKDANGWVRAAAVGALAMLGDRTAVPALIAALKDPDREVRRGAAWALGEMGDKSAVRPLSEELKDHHLKDPDTSVCAAAARALGQLGDSTAVPLLIGAIKDADRWVRAGAAAALANMGEVGEVYKAFVERPEIPLFNIIRTDSRFDDNGLKQLTGSRDPFLKSAGYYVLALRSKVQAEADSEKQLQYSQKAFENIDPKAYTALAILSLWLKAEAEIYLAKLHDASETIKIAENHLAYLSPIERENYGELFEEYTLFLKGEVYARIGEDKTAIGNYEAARERLHTSRRIRIASGRRLWGRDEREAERLESLIKKRLGTIGAKYYAEIREEGIKIGEQYKPRTELEMEIDEGAYAQQLVQVSGKGNYEEAQRLAEELAMRRAAYLNRKLDIKLADTDKQKSIDEYRIKQKSIDALEEKKRNLATKGASSTAEAAREESPELKKVDAEIRTKQRELNNYLVELKKDHPDLAALLGAKPIELKNTQEKLSSETALLQYILLPGKLVIFIIKATGIDIQEEPLHKDLKAKVEQYQKHLKNIEKSKQLTDETRKELHQIYADLYEILIRPVQGKLQGITTLGISPNGYLHYVPFGALWAKEGGEPKYLIDQYRAIFYVNSTSIFWVATDRAGKGNVSESNLVAYINPDESLKFAKEEEKELKGIFKNNKIYYGGEAKKEALESMVLSNTVLHFSTHGSLNSRDSSKSYLVMANNRNLTVQDIWGLPLKGNVVTTLSACETSRGELLSGDDIVSLENAFIYAGSPSVVSTLWKVDERATAELVTAFYRNLVDAKKKMSKAEALTQAQKKVKDTSTHYKDPYFWAGFMLRGTYQ